MVCPVEREDPDSKDPAVCSSGNSCKEMRIEMEKGMMLVRTEKRPVGNILQSGQFKEK